MDEQTTGKNLHKIWTIPNLMSMLRLLLVPLFCWVYLGLHNIWWAVGLLALSGLTDIADGYVARRFDMVSEFGKALDPVADKVTQGAVLLCLLITYPLLMPIFIVLVIREVTDGITGLLVMKKTGQVLGAVWHGKLTTVLLFGTMALHLLWQLFPSWGTIPAWLTLTLCCLCCAMMTLSLVLYTIRNVRAIREYEKEKKLP